MLIILKPEKPIRSSESMESAQRVLHWKITPAAWWKRFALVN